MSETGATLVWYRRDLRIRDHAALLDAARCGPVVCVYCLDPGQWATGSPMRQLDLARMGTHRTRFLLESLIDLRQSLQRLGADLVIRRGDPVEVIPALIEELGARGLVFHEGVGTEEIAQEAVIRRAAFRRRVSVRSFWDLTLVPLGKLPFPVCQTPDVFTAFRKRVEKHCEFEPPLREPSQLAGVPGVRSDELPGVRDLAGEDAVDDPRAVLRFHGGETQAWRRLEEWFWDRDCLQSYKRTRNQMVGADYSSKFSPWLANGCVSTRHIQHEIACYERKRVRNDSTYWLTFELLWRDYFQLIARRYGAALFRPSGLQGIDLPWRSDPESFERWCAGTTGYPIVDANMRELAATGFLSNRGRQIVVSFLTKNLGLDWRWGAEWFENRLIDHDVASNYGNWNYGAGIGNDARGFRYFHLPSQAQKYDRRGEHAKLWCPELEPLGPRHVHSPWTLGRSRQKELGVRIGHDYPMPMVDLDRSVAENRAAWERAVSA